jgi:hypothetical protein
VTASVVGAVALQTSFSIRDPVLTIAELLALALLAGALAGLVALGYRWYARERVPTGLPVLAGLSGVALYRGTSTALGQVIVGAGPSVDPLSIETALVNVVTFVAAGLVAVGAARAGDRLGVDLFASTGGRSVEGEVSRLVEAVGRVVAVELPEEIDDVVGYDPVPAETTEKLEGRTFLFPKKLTVADLEARLASRLRSDYGVGHVDVDLAADGSVEYLAVGARVAGIGPTLPPDTVAVAVHADPAFAASAGDVVQVWSTTPRDRVTTGEIRGVTGDVVTLAVDAADAQRLDPSARYRLVTLPVESRGDREFASLLRSADETMAVVTLSEGSPLLGRTVGSLDVAVVAVRAGGAVDPLPDWDRVLAAGESLYAIGTPAALRRVDAAATDAGAAPTATSGADAGPQ